MMTSSHMASSQPDFEFLCFVHRLEMSPTVAAHDSTIRWVYRASKGTAQSTVMSREVRHDRAAQHFLRLAKDSEAKRQAILESERLAQARRSGLALSFGVALATLAFGGVMAAWTDVAAAPGLRGPEAELSIAAGSPADEASPLFFSLPEGVLPPRLLETEPIFLDGPMCDGAESFYDFVGPSGLAEEDRPREVDTTEPTPQRQGRSRARRNSSSSHVPRTLPASASRREAPRAQPIETRNPVSETSERETTEEIGMTFSHAELELPSSLSRGQIVGGLHGVSRMVRNCAVGEPDRTVRVDLTIESSGQVTSAHVRGYHARTTAGACVTRALRRARFPRFSGDALVVSAHPLVLR